MRSRGTFYQYVLIAFGVISSLLFAIFAYREMFPEYRIYQQDFIALENFRSSYLGEPPPHFEEGIKQIVIERPDKGPPAIDRCTSCHVALQIEDYSPTKIAKDLNGNTIYDKEGNPIKVENPDYVWKRVDESPQNDLKALKTAVVGKYTYDVTKVLKMHPLMGKETRPFEFHPIEDYGCVSCHGGNGRGLVTDRAHGPVFDEQYEKESEGFVPEFLEKDPVNDPPFSHVFNAKPGARLLFQVNPLYVGALIQSKCMQCHQTTKESLYEAKQTTETILKTKQSTLASAKKAYESEKARVQSLIDLKKSLSEVGYERTLKDVEEKAANYALPEKDRQAFVHQVQFIQQQGEKSLSSTISKQLIEALGSEENINHLEKALENPNNQNGTLFEKRAYFNYTQELLQHISDVSSLNEKMVTDEKAVGDIETDVDLLTKDYKRGKDLFISQGCYACHRIAGFSRGGVGPELTLSGESYPWFIKESIVWPQADLKTSTMPNMRLDHEELEPLITYLLGQVGQNQSISKTARKLAIQEWELGKKQALEKPISIQEMQDIKYGMTVFALEGCASCHRMLGFESNVGFKKEKESEDPMEIEKEKLWFKTLFPEFILGSQIVATIEKHKKEIEERIVPNVRKNSLIEELETKQPGSIAALYSNFKYAMRAKNQESEDKREAWKRQVDLVLKMFIQTYGLGRMICPNLSWSGVYRSDQWLLGHFLNPSALVPKSIMPIFPFDETKFYALTLTLDKLAKKNVQKERQIRKRGAFNPESAYQYYCSQCHGGLLEGNGPIAEWIYPPPKNLKNAEFLRSLTKEEAIHSITHGVKGTPMPPWGELGEGKPFENKTPVLNDEEISRLVDWLFSNIPGSTVIKESQEVPKWNYEPKNVLKELNEEGHPLNSVFDDTKNGSFIKQKYYTKENIQKGMQFFLDNCAACHGKEADGAGIRAEAMQDAKPRMLVNLDWIDSRDDLRLLRSIKYGVPGTSMTPWGDVTSALQRIQLVIYIRSLSKEKVKQRELENTLYSVFDPGYPSLKNEAFFKFSKQQKTAFTLIGRGFLNLKADDALMDIFSKLLHTKPNTNQRKELENQLLSAIDRKIQGLQNAKTIEEGKLTSNEKSAEIKRIEAEISAWTKQKHLLIFQLAEIQRENPLKTVQEKGPS